MLDNLNPLAIHRPAENLNKLAVEINSAHVQGEADLRKGLAHFVRAGKILLKVKEQCGHGKFGAWLKKNIKFSERSARIYMSLVKSAAPADLNASIRSLIEDPPRENVDKPKGVTNSAKGNSKSKSKTTSLLSNDDAEDDEETENTETVVEETAPTPPEKSSDTPPTAHPDREPAKIVVETITTELCLNAITTITKECRRIKDAMSQIMSSPFGGDLRAFLCKMRGVSIDRCEVYQTGDKIEGGSWGIVSFVVNEYTTEELDQFCAFVGTMKDWFRQADAKLVERPPADDTEPEDLGEDTRGDDDGRIPI